ncbi:MAG: ATP-binding protein [Firmicutes bacterium]|nr:ATP-binding protein [Bacillota bacterium]
MKQLLILSGKGGTGKTTIASAFIKLSQARAYADCDVDAPNLHLIMAHEKPIKTDYYGMEKAEIDFDTCIECGLCKDLCKFDAITLDSGYKVDQFACEGCGVCEAFCPVKAITLNPAIAGELELFINDSVFSTAQLKMGSGTSGLLVTEVKKQILDRAEGIDLAIIDGSPGIGCPVIASLSGVDMVLVVAEPSMSGISDMKRIIETASYFNTKTLVCINKYDSNEIISKSIIEFCDKEGIEYVGGIPFDEKVLEATNSGKSIVDIECPAKEAVEKVFKEAISFLE